MSPVKSASGKIIGASKIARDITERKTAEARQRLLTRELHHRTKNLFAVVQAVVSRSFAGKGSVEEAQTAVLERLHSLGQAHILLVDREWQGTDLLELARGETRPFSDRVSMSGPPLVMSPQAAQNFALALHELATNSAKYGALSSPHGRVVISWSVDHAARTRRVHIPLAGARRAPRGAAGAQGLRQRRARAGDGGVRQGAAADRIRSKRRELSGHRLPRGHCRRRRGSGRGLGSADRAWSLRASAGRMRRRGVLILGVGPT